MNVIYYLYTIDFIIQLKNRRFRIQKIERYIFVSGNSGISDRRSHDTNETSGIRAQ